LSYGIKKRVNDFRGQILICKETTCQVGDLMRNVSAFAFVTCGDCGLKMKIPPEYKGSQIKCLRCKKISTIQS